MYHNNIRRSITLTYLFTMIYLKKKGKKLMTITILMSMVILLKTPVVNFLQEFLAKADKQLVAKQRPAHPKHKQGEDPLILNRYSYSLSFLKLLRPSGNWRGWKKSQWLMKTLFRQRQISFYYSGASIIVNGNLLCVWKHYWWKTMENNGGRKPQRRDSEVFWQPLLLSLLWTEISFSRSEKENLLTSQQCNNISNVF